MGFQGFSRDTLAYLAALEANNTRDWFEAHRAEYQALWLTPGLDLAAALSGPVSQLGLMAVPKLNGSLRRIHRDTRFSNDKRPYAPRLHLILSTGPDFNKVPGVHLVLGPHSFGHGAGRWAFDAPGLDRMRQAFCDPVARQQFLALLDRARAVGETLDPPDLARLPKGFSAAPDWEHLLRLKHIVVRTQSDPSPPDWLFGPDCLENLLALVAEIAPLAHWITALL